MSLSRDHAPGAVSGPCGRATPSSLARRTLAATCGALLGLLGTACGGSPGSPGPATIGAESPAPEATPDGAPPTEPEPDAAPETPPTEPCQTDLDCTLHTDSCGIPQGARVGSTPPQHRERPCPSGDPAAVEPHCALGQCQTRAVTDAGERRCLSQRDCVLARGLCGSWEPVNRAFRREHEAAARRTEVLADCAPDALPRPDVACLVSVCVAR